MSVACAWSYCSFWARCLVVALALAAVSRMTTARGDSAGIPVGGEVRAGLAS